MRFSPSVNPRLTDPQLRGLGGATEKRKLQQYQKNQKKKRKDQHRKDLQRKMEYYKPTIEQQPVRNSKLEEDMMSMEAKMDRIKKKEANKFKLFSSFRPKPAETEEIRKCLDRVVRKNIRSSIFSKGRSRALDSFLHQFARSDDVRKWEEGDEPTASRANKINATYAQNDSRSSGSSYIDFSGAVRCLQPRAKRRKKQSKNKSVKTELGSPSIDLWSPSEDLFHPISLDPPILNNGNGNTRNQTLPFFDGEVTCKDPGELLRVATLMGDELNVHSLTDCTYKEQQLIEAAVN